MLLMEVLFVRFDTASVVGYQAMVADEWAAFYSYASFVLDPPVSQYFPDCGQFGAHITLQLNYKPVNLTSIACCGNSGYRFFIVKGRFAIKHSLTIKKPTAYRIPQRFEGIFT